jgi:hypothetical protein
MNEWNTIVISIITVITPYGTPSRVGHAMSLGIAPKILRVTVCLLLQHRSDGQEGIAPQRYVSFCTDRTAKTNDGRLNNARTCYLLENSLFQSLALLCFGFASICLCYYYYYYCCQ